MYTNSFSEVVAGSNDVLGNQVPLSEVSAALSLENRSTMASFVQIDTGKTLLGLGFSCSVTITCAVASSQAPPSTV